MKLNTNDPVRVEIDIRSIFQVLLRWWWVIVLLTIMFSITAYFLSVRSYQPTFTATSTMVVNSKQVRVNGENNFVTANDIVVSQKLVNTYHVILKSNRVMEYVAQDLKIDMSPEEMQSYVTVTSVEDSEVLFLTVQHADPRMAVNIANSIMKVAPKAIAETVEVGSVKVVDYAKLPKYPVPPRTVKNTTIGAFIGLMLGILITFFLGFMRGKVVNSNDVSTKLLLTPLGEIPHARTKGRRRCSNNPLVSNDTIDLGFIEAFKALRANILYLSRTHNAHKILITSAMADEGRTMVSINLALSLASSGKSVVLLDCNLREPAIHEKLGLEVNPERGITTVLNFQCEAAEAIIHAENLGISVLPCGKTAQNSAELLSSDAMQRLLDELTQYYDYMIMDSPPANVLCDAVAMCPYVDGVILVIRKEHAKIKAIVETIDSLKIVEAHIMGGVLNDVKKLKKSIGNILFR